MKWMTALSLALVLAFGAMAQAQPACETTYTGPNDAEWEEPTNWDAGKPDSTKVACIPHDKTVEVKSDAEAQAIWIKRSGATQGKVEVCYGGNSLKLYENSQIDGLLQFEVFSQDSTELLIANDLTITGDGGAIVHFGANGSAPIRGDDGNEVLTITGGSSRPSSLVLHGRLDIQVSLVNNAYVVANLGDMTLRTNSKSGNGYWIAERDYTGGVSHGQLVVDVAVSGAGRWELTDHGSAKIWFKQACTGLTGNFLIQKGTLDIGADVTTTGNFKVQSVSGVTPIVNVAMGAVVTLD